MQCCTEVRVFLDCSVLATEPCRGFKGCGSSSLVVVMSPPTRPRDSPAEDTPPRAVLAFFVWHALPLTPAAPPFRPRNCADLPKQFHDVPGSGLETYVCHQFPDEANVVHRIIAGLLMARFACASLRREAGSLPASLACTQPPPGGNAGGPQPGTYQD